MRPRTEVTVRMTRDHYTELMWLLKPVRDRLFRTANDPTSELITALEAAEFDPLLDERVTVGSSYRRGSG